MTATRPTVHSANAGDDSVLARRLEELRAERAQVLSELVPAGNGDDADRATNVDGHIQLAMLDGRIADVELELASAPATQPADGVVAIGDLVTLDFGDGPERFVLGSVEYASRDVDVVTPSSPLGRVLEGASVGDRLTYQARRGPALQVTVVSVG